MATNIEIKNVTLDHIAALQHITRQTFYETFAADNNEADMIKYLQEALSVEQLTAELNNEYSDFYFAMLNDNVIGYLKLNFGGAQTELQEKNALEIERIYVLKEFHGKNVGQLLYEKAMAIARQKNYDYVWLGVWEKNLRAIQFYKKNGFVPFGTHVFHLGNDAQTDIMMKLYLKY
ncbi:MAG: GNAT family N-acetyltransferase [Sphingobacteriales bacterium]|nr:GNAT family N-acetyltransferase [Sphingobacteriales bacterium]